MNTEQRASTYILNFYIIKFSQPISFYGLLNNNDGNYCLHNTIQNTYEELRGVWENLYVTKTVHESKI